MPGPHGGILHAPGLCAYCETPTQDSCRICDRSICADHLVEGTLLCEECRAAPAED